MAAKIQTEDEKRTGLKNKREQSEKEVNWGNRGKDGEYTAKRSESGHYKRMMDIIRGIISLSLLYQ